MRIKTDDLLNDFHEGLRTKQFLSKYGLTIAQFEHIVKALIRDGHLTKDQFREWKARRRISTQTTIAEEPFDDLDTTVANVETYVIVNPEETNSTALELFSTKQDLMKGTKFKIVLHGKKYAFMVEEMLYRGPVEMTPDAEEDEEAKKAKREEAIAYISRHGWAAYLENRAYLANFGEDGDHAGKKAKLVLVHCTNATYLAAVHTPAPAISIYVASTLGSLKRRLANAVDLTELQV
jgi:hypothetical protein